MDPEPGLFQVGSGRLAVGPWPGATLSRAPCPEVSGKRPWSASTLPARPRQDVTSSLTGQLGRRPASTALPACLSSSLHGACRRPSSPQPSPGSIPQAGVEGTRRAGPCWAAEKQVHPEEATPSPFTQLGQLWPEVPFLKQTHSLVASPRTRTHTHTFSRQVTVGVSAPSRASSRDHAPVTCRPRPAQPHCRGSGGQSASVTNWQVRGAARPPPVYLPVRSHPAPPCIPFPDWHSSAAGSQHPALSHHTPAVLEWDPDLAAP